MASIQKQILQNPFDPGLWNLLVQAKSAESPDSEWRHVLQAAGRRAGEIKSFVDLLVEERFAIARQKLDYLVTDGLVDLYEWQLLQIVGYLYQGRFEQASNLCESFLETQKQGSPLASACNLLRKLAYQGRINPKALVNILSGVFGFESDYQDVTTNFGLNWDAPRQAQTLVPIHERPGWQAVLKCTENDPESRFLLEYYLSVVDGVFPVERPLMCTEEPVVTVVIPVYNLWPLLQNCIKSISGAANSIPFEIIVADDCSTDETTELLKVNPWLRHVRMETNGRFIRNCNNAARYAKGEIIYFLNNDTVVLDHWLDRLLDVFKSRPEAGIVGSQVLFHNHRVQEAGGIIWPDGEAWNFGRNIENDKIYQVNYLREVDYISGCALAIRRHLWEEVGGFSEEYIPAYCEDSDLCFKVRALGRKVWVQPQSRIIHFEGLSNSKDIEKGLKAYQKINLQKLNQKWRLAILARGVASTSDILHASNYRLRTHRTVLIVDHYVPQPDKDAGSRTVQAFCEALIHLGYNVVFLPENYTAHQPYTSNLEALGVMVLYGNHVANNLEDVLKNQLCVVDCILYNRPHITNRYIELISGIFPSAKALYYMHDMHGLREYLEKNFNPELFGAPFDLQDAELLTPDEKNIIDRVDLALTCSPKEQELLLAEHPNVSTITPYAINPEAEPSPDLQAHLDVASRKELLFVGGFGHSPNRLGIEWFVQYVLPLLKEDIRIHVVGSRCPVELKSKLQAHPLIEFHGFASDDKLEELLRRTTVSLAPLPYGAGIKGKVVEAFAAGHTVIGTEYGIEGMEDSPPDIYRVCRTAQDFSDAINKVFRRNLDEWKQVRQQARQYVAGRFNQQSIQKVLSDAIGPSRRDVFEVSHLLQKEIRTQLVGCALLPSSSGLEHDGWLLCDHQLVVAVDDGTRELVISGYLPDGDSFEYSGPMEIVVDASYGDNQSLSFVKQVQLGMNSISIRFPAGHSLSVVVVELSIFYRFRPAGSADRRELAMLISSIAGV